MLSSLGLSSPTLKILPYQTVFFLHPPAEFEHLDKDRPTPADPILWGRLTLSLPKPKEIKDLVVKLVTYYTVAIPGHNAETGVLEEISVKVDVGVSLEKGTHTFAWSMPIPRTSAPYERCAFGRIYHRLHAIAKGAGLGGSDVKDEVQIELIVNPSEEGDTTGLNERIEGFQEEVGPYLMTLASQHVTVGGPVHFTLNLPSAPADLRIQSVTGWIVQKYNLSSPAQPTIKASPPPQRRLLFKLDHRTSVKRPGTPPSPRQSRQTVLNVSGPALPGILAAVPAGESLEISHLARFPDDDVLRPTTQHGTKTPIRLAHEVLLEVAFEHATPGGRPRVLRSTRAITISSCCCMLESLMLPSYSEVPRADAPPGGTTRKARCPAAACVCGMTIEALLSAAGDPTLQDHAALGSPASERGQPIVLPKAVPS